MATSLTTRNTDGPGVDLVKGSPLTSLEVDTNFITLAENKLERNNNLSDITDDVAARVNIDVPSREGAGAFGTWSISVTGNSATTTQLQNAREITGVAFDGTSDITIEAATPNDLIFGSGLSSSGNYDGSIERILSVDTGVVVVTTGSQTIDGSKTFQNAVTLNTQATAVGHAVRADRLINSGNGLIGGANLTDDVTLEIDTGVVVATSGNQTIGGVKTFTSAVELSTAGSTTTQAVRGDRSVTGGDGLDGGGNLTANRELSVDDTVIRTTGNQTLGGTKTFTNPPVLSAASTSTNEAVRSDRNISSGDGLSGGGNLTSNLTLSVDNTVIRTSGNQTLGGSKTFSSVVILEVQGTSPNEAIRGSRNLTAGDGISGGGNLTADRTFAVDSSVVRTTGSQTLGGTKTFSDPIVLTAPTVSTDQAVRADRTITGDDGISGGGNLASDQTLSVDSTVIRTTGDQTLGGTKSFTEAVELGGQATTASQAVRADRQVIAGDGLGGGGNLSSNVTLDVDDTVVRTTGDFTFTGDYIFTGDVTLSNQAGTTNNPVRADRTITGGDGVNGGGNLLNDLTFSVDSSVVRTSRQITAGDGLNGGGSLGSNVTLNVDADIAREAVSTQLSEIVTLVVGDVLTSDGLAQSDIDSAGDSDVTDSDLILDSDYTGLLIGEIVTGLDSGARGIVTTIVDDSDSASIDVRITSGSFNEAGEVIEGEDSGELIEIESASTSETFEAQDIRSSGEVIDFIPSSSENIENVLDISNALDKVLAIGGKSFDWTDDHLSNKGVFVDEETGETGDLHIQKSDFGVVAEDVQSVFPQGVREKENGELVVDYRKLFALAFAAIKELNDKIV
jgi:hypothetical protein